MPVRGIDDEEKQAQRLVDEPAESVVSPSETACESGGKQHDPEGHADQPHGDLQSQ
jgi:hypothetical protein